MQAPAKFLRLLSALPGRVYRWLFDFSQGHAEGRRWQRLLRTALAETQTEAGFLRTMRRLISEEEPAKIEERWGFFLRQLSEYTTQETGDKRAGAQRMLAALPRLYGFPPSDAQSRKADAP